MKQPSQKILVLKHMLRWGSITDKVARDKYGITRLAARIDDLSRIGWQRWWVGGVSSEPLVNTKMVEFRTRTGRKGRYAKYSVEGNEAWRNLFKNELEGK